MHEQSNKTKDDYPPSQFGIFYLLIAAALCLCLLTLNKIGCLGTCP